MPPPAPEGVSDRAPPVTLTVVCGFSGEINLTGGAADPVAVAAMADTMQRRGPDSSGLFAQGGVALGHRRLKIIDLSERGAQPMVDAELGLAVAFNGCIYNHHELRRELEGHGYRFFSTSDTEALLKAYHHWGDRFVDHLVGMFALVITERDTGRVVLVRDRLGIKPLYLAESGGTLRFASTLPALVAATRPPTGGSRPSGRRPTPGGAPPTGRTPFWPRCAPPSSAGWWPTCRSGACCPVGSTPASSSGSSPRRGSPTSSRSASGSSRSTASRATSSGTPTSLPGTSPPTTTRSRSPPTGRCPPSATPSGP